MGINPCTHINEVTKRYLQNPFFFFSSTVSSYKPSQLTGAPGGTHIVKHKGMCHFNGSPFSQEILKHGSNSLQKYP